MAKIPGYINLASALTMDTSMSTFKTLLQVKVASGKRALLRPRFYVGGKTSLPDQIFFRVVRGYVDGQGTVTATPPTPIMPNVRDANMVVSDILTVRHLFTAQPASTPILMAPGVVPLLAVGKWHWEWSEIEHADNINIEYMNKSTTAVAECQVGFDFEV